MRTRLTSRLSLLFMAFALMLALPAMAFADDLRNDLDNTFEADYEIVGLQPGGSTDEVTIRLQAQGSDGQGGCNVDSGETLKIKAQSDNTSAATVKWNATGTDTVQFLGCNANGEHVVTVTSGSAGTAHITFSIVSNTTGSGTYDLLPARFQVDVAAPPNTAPSVSVTGPVDGDTYEHGTVPAAGCDVDDAEDANESAEPVVGPSDLNSYGLGSETVTCSYTDGSDVTESASATYTIVDTTAPVIASHANVTAEATGPNGAEVTYTAPATSDAVLRGDAVAAAPR